MKKKLYFFLLLLIFTGEPLFAHSFNKEKVIQLLHSMKKYKNGIIVGAASLISIPLICWFYNRCIKSKKKTKEQEDKLSSNPSNQGISPLSFHEVPQIQEVPQNISLNQGTKPLNEGSNQSSSGENEHIQNNKGTQIPQNNSPVPTGIVKELKLDTKYPNVLNAIYHNINENNPSDLFRQSFRIGDNNASKTAYSQKAPTNDNIAALLSQEIKTYGTTDLEDKITSNFKEQKKSQDIPEQVSDDEAKQVTAFVTALQENGYNNNEVENLAKLIQKKQESRAGTKSKQTQ